MPDADAIKSEILSKISALLADATIPVTEDIPLLGGESVLTSMQLVELCLALEDRAAELGFDFDWKSEEAMSKSRSMFRTAGSLSDEFVSQLAAGQ